MITETGNDHIRLNGLIEGTKEEVRRQALKHIEEGFTSLKLKVGGDIKQEIEKVQMLDAEIQGRALLHLDANQTWNLEAAVEFGNEVGCAAIEYIEEPFKNINDIPDFFMKTTIPVALDESLCNLGFDKIKSIEGLDFLIIKPTVLGGLEKTWQIMQKAHAVALNTVISSCYETSAGILMLANMSGCSKRDYYAGLDTLHYFKEDLLVDGIVVQRGKINLERDPLSVKDINFDLLIEVNE